MRSFRLDVPQAQLDDLARRLARTRLPDELPGVGRDLGLEREVLEEVLDHWRHRYDWRRFEARVNAYEQWIVDTRAAGDVHVVHAPSPHAGAVPLVLLHGWPGSICEFLDVIEPLRDPVAHGGDAADAFHVVVTSMPGYGFSGPTVRQGVTGNDVADAVAEVMTALGYEHFVAQGGDWGSLVARCLGEHHASRVIGAHFTMLFALPVDGVRSMDGVTPDEQRRMARSALRTKDGLGYMLLQGTKPHALGPSQSDSPAGLAAWIIEKFQAWSDLGDLDELDALVAAGGAASSGRQVIGSGRLDSVYTWDQLLDNVMCYWLPNTAQSSARLYFESARAGVAATSDWKGKVPVPTGHAVYPGELLQTPRVWADARYDIVHWTHQSRGGHFAAFEQPAIFTADLRAFARLVR